MFLAGLSGARVAVAFAIFHFSICFVSLCAKLKRSTTLQSAELYNAIKVLNTKQIRQKLFKFIPEKSGKKKWKNCEGGGRKLWKKHTRRNEMRKAEVSPGKGVKTLFALLEKKIKMAHEAIFLWFPLRDTEFEVASCAAVKLPRHRNRAGNASNRRKSLVALDTADCGKNSNSTYQKRLQHDKACMEDPLQEW